MKLSLPALLVALLLAAPAAWGGPAFNVPAQLWEQPRTATALLAQPALRQAVSAWAGEPEGRLVLHHGSGEEALLRAEELRGWLAALAVDAVRVDLAGDLPGGEEIRIELIARPPRGKK